MLYLVAVVVLAILVGQLIAIPAFIAIYLWRWGGFGWKMIVIYTGCAWLFLWGFYDQIMHLQFIYPVFEIGPFFE